MSGSVTAINNATNNELVTIGSTTTELDAEANLTFTGSALTCIGTVTVGVDNTGHDVKYFGATSGSFLLWDESDDALELTDSSPIKIGDSGDMTIYHDGTDSFVTNSQGGLKLATETSGIAVTIGHTTSETTVADNLTVTGEFAAANFKVAGTDFTGSVLVGHSTTGTLSSASYNTGVGIEALDALTSGTSNVATGYRALSKATDGLKNTAIGRYALFDVVGGEANTAIGDNSGFNVTGDKNITIGWQAGDNITSGDGNVIIGNVDAGSATGDTQLIIADGVDGSVKWIDGDSSGNVIHAGTTHSAGGQLTTTGKAVVFGF